MMPIVPPVALCSGRPLRVSGALPFRGHRPVSIVSYIRIMPPVAKNWMATEEPDCAAALRKDGQTLRAGASAEQGHALVVLHADSQWRRSSLEVNGSATWRIAWLPNCASSQAASKPNSAAITRENGRTFLCQTSKARTLLICGTFFGSINSASFDFLANRGRPDDQRVSDVDSNNASRFHVGRVAGGDCDHRAPGRALLAGGHGRARSGAPHAVRQQPQATRPRAAELRERLQKASARLPSAKRAKWGGEATAGPTRTVR